MALKSRLPLPKPGMRLPERIKAAEERLAADRNFLAQKLALHKTYPNVTFSDSMTILHGRP